YMWSKTSKVQWKRKIKQAIIEISAMSNCPLKSLDVRKNRGHSLSLGCDGCFSVGIVNPEGVTPIGQSAPQIFQQATWE
ncbi:MAG: hypothetical protein ACPG9T_08755, partial [Pseudomonadales bacterium]